MVKASVPAVIVDCGFTVTVLRRLLGKACHCTPSSMNVLVRAVGSSPTQ